MLEIFHLELERRLQLLSAVMKGPSLWEKERNRKIIKNSKGIPKE